MFKFISPIFIWAFVRMHKKLLKRFFFYSVIYSFLLFILIDFQELFSPDMMLQFKLLKWFLIAVCITHFYIIINSFKARNIPSDKKTSVELRHLGFTKKEKIIDKYKRR